MDGVIGFWEGCFELAVWPRDGSGLMVKEAVGERAAELLVKKDKQERDPGSFLLTVFEIPQIPGFNVRAAPTKA